MTLKKRLIKEQRVLLAIVIVVIGTCGRTDYRTGNHQKSIRGEQK